MFKKLLLPRVLLQSSLPFLLGTTLSLLKEPFIESKNTSSISNHSEILDFIRETCIALYDSYFHFMIAMLLINLILKAVIMLKEFLTRKLEADKINDKRIFDNEDLSCQDLCTKRQIRAWLLASLCFSCVFALFSIIGIYADSDMKSLIHLPQETFSKNVNENVLYNSRVLLEKEKEDQSLVTKEKISFSLGKLLGTLEMEACSLILSKNNKLAFVVISYYQTLKIIDISDAQFPNILTTFPLNLNERAFRTVSLLLSDDESTLFMYNFKTLHLINVTHVKTPHQFAWIDTEDGTAFEKYCEDNTFKFPENFPASMALSKDEKILYLGGIALQVYSLADLKKPSRISFISRNEWNDQSVLSTLTVSSDGHYLFLANGTLDVYNITEPNKPFQITSFKTESAINSIALSQDNQKAYAAGFCLSLNRAIIEELNITNLQSLSKVSQVTLSSDGKSWRYPSIIAQSPRGSQLYIILNSAASSSDFDLVVYHTLTRAVTDTNQSIVQKPSALAFSADSKMVFTASKKHFNIMELFTSYPNKRIFSLMNNSIVEFGTNEPWKITLISEDNKFLFAAYNDTRGGSVLEIYNITNRAAPSLMNSIPLSAPIITMQLSTDSTKAYIQDTEGLFVLDLSSDFKNSKKLYTIGSKFPIIGFSVSLDERFIFFMYTSENKANLTVFDLEANKEVQTYIIEEKIRMKSNSCKLLTLKDNKLLLIVMKNAYIYQINQITGKLKGFSDFDLTPENIEVNIYSATLSPDQTTLFVENYNHFKFRKLTIIDMKNLTAPKILSETSLPSASFIENGINFPLFLNKESVYIYQDTSLLKIDVTNLSAPKIFGMTLLYVGKGEEVSSVVVTKDGLTGFVSDLHSRVHVLTLQANYTVLIDQESFPLGQKYSDHVNLLKISEQEGGDYQLVSQGSVKFLRFFLVDFKTEADKAATEMTFLAAPYWMNFDKENYILTLDPKKQSDIGTYTIYFAFSKKIPLDAFLGGIMTIDSPEKSHDLMALLISMGYVDNQRFLTSSFGYFEDFIVPSNWTSQRQQIYDILRKYYIDTCNQFDIISSLEVVDSHEKLEIISASTNMLKVDITLLNNLSVKFLNKPYASLQPVIIDKKSRLLIEGPLKEINQALKDIVINMEQDDIVCNGQITVADGLNYPVTRTIVNMQNYFKKNDAPKLKISVQEQIDAQSLARPILTGNYLSIILNEKTFEDKNSEMLSYELIMPGKNASLPNWITIHGLEIQGTPPEELFGRDVSLYLVASNEFKRIEEPFTLHINLSSGFIGKLLLRYSPYILTVLTLWINANRIYNILLKKRYRYVRDVVLVAGEKVDANVVFPIYFIAEENKESQFLLKELKKRAGGDLKKLASGEMNKEGILDKAKILRDIKEIVSQMRAEDKEEKLQLYTSKSVLKKQLINQLVLNEIVLKGQIELKSEKLTKTVFDNLREQWINVVEWNHPLGFIVNEAKLAVLLRQEKAGVKSIITKRETTSIQLIQTNHDLIQERPLLLSSDNQEESLYEPEINLKLLQDAIIAHAFSLHSLRSPSIRADVVIKQRIKMNWLFRFIKFDLKNIYLNERSKIDYGINYKIKDDILFFYGEVDESLVGKTLVVQITDPRSQILKEIWMHGKSNEDDDCYVEEGLETMRQSKDGKYEVF